MFLEIRDIKQNSFKVSVKLNHTILEVKEQIKLKIDIIDIGDQTLVYSGNILANDKTVEECDIEKNDYVTLIYRSKQMEEVAKIIENIRDESKRETSEYIGHMSKDDNSESFEKDSDTTGMESYSDGDQIMDSLNDSETEDLSRYALLDAIPDVQNLRKVITNDPVVLPKHLQKLSRQRPHVFEKILENQHAYIDLLYANEHCTVDNGLIKVETKNCDAIDRLVSKGYEREIAKQVYEACDFDESSAAELLNYLH